MNWIGVGLLIALALGVLWTHWGGRTLTPTCTCVGVCEPNPCDEVNLISGKWRER